MLSTPPASISPPSPDRMACAADATACSPDPQRRFTVWPGTSTGNPARSAAIRATFRLSSPAPLAQPRITSSIRSDGRDARSSRPRSAAAARSSGRMSASAPPARPIGVRTALVMKTSVMEFVRVSTSTRVAWLSRASHEDSALTDPRPPAKLRPRNESGQVAEWLKAHAWRACLLRPRSDPTGFVSGVGQACCEGP